MANVALYSLFLFICLLGPGLEKIISTTCLSYLANKWDNPLDETHKTEAPCHQQMWHDKDPSLLEGNGRRTNLQPFTNNDTVNTNCYYSYLYNYYYCSYYYRPVGSIVGAVIGSLVGLACLIGLIVFFCCIRPLRLAAAGQVIHTPGNNVTVVPTTAAGGHVNTAAYLPGIQATYYQYTYPPQQAAPPSGYQPPPAYK